MSNWIFIPGAIVSIGALLTFVWKGIRAFVHVQDAVPVLLEMSKEFQPNSGKTLRDAIDRLDASVAVIDQRTLRTERKVTDLEKVVARNSVEGHHA